MTPQERELLTNLVARLKQAPPAETDDEAAGDDPGPGPRPARRALPAGPDRADPGLRPAPGPVPDRRAGAPGPAAARQPAAAASSAPSSAAPRRRARSRRRTATAGSGLHPGTAGLCPGPARPMGRRRWALRPILRPVLPAQRRRHRGRRRRRRAAVPGHRIPVRHGPWRARRLRCRRGPRPDRDGGQQLLWRRRTRRRRHRPARRRCRARETRVSRMPTIRTTAARISAATISAVAATTRWASDAGA